MGSFSRNKSGALARALMTRQQTMKELAASTGLVYRRLIRLSQGAQPLPHEKILIAQHLGVEVESIWPLSIASGDLQPALLRKLVNDLLADDDLAFIVGRAITKVMAKYS